MLPGFQDSVTKAYINKIPYFLWNLLKFLHCFAKYLGIIMRTGLVREETMALYTSKHQS